MRPTRGVRRRRRRALRRAPACRSPRRARRRARRAPLLASGAKAEWFSTAGSISTSRTALAEAATGCWNDRGRAAAIGFDGRAGSGRDRVVRTDGAAVASELDHEDDDQKVLVAGPALGGWRRHARDARGARCVYRRRAAGSSADARGAVLRPRHRCAPARRLAVRRAPSASAVVGDAASRPIRLRRACSPRSRRGPDAAVHAEARPRRDVCGCRVVRRRRSRPAWGASGALRNPRPDDYSRLSPEAAAAARRVGEGGGDVNIVLRRLHVNIATAALALRLVARGGSGCDVGDEAPSDRGSVDRWLSRPASWVVAEHEPVIALSHEPREEVAARLQVASGVAADDVAVRVDEEPQGAREVAARLPAADDGRPHWSPRLHARHTGSAEAPFVCTLAISVQPPPSIGRPLLVTKAGMSLLGNSWPPNSSLG